MNDERLTFGAGVPTAADVKRLRDTFPVKVGDLVLYSEISSTIQCPFRSSRWSSVVMAWRKQLDRELNLILEAVPNKGFVVMNNDDRIHYSSGKYKRGIRQVRRASDVALRTDIQGLSPDAYKARDHIIAAGASIRLAAATAAKQLKWPDPQKQ